MNETNTATQAETVQTGLTLQDLNLALQVIQVSSTRGAFKAEELATIGGLHDRIYKFLEASGAFVKAPSPADTAPATPEVEPTAPAPKARKTKKVKE